MQKGEASISLASLSELFQKSADIIFQEFTFHGEKVYFITCEAMVDQRLLYEVIIPQVQKFLENSDMAAGADFTQLHIPGLKNEIALNDIIPLVYRGYLLLYFEGAQLLYSSNIANKPNRKPEETRMEVLVKGPRDNFIEDIATNIALIRKRLPTNSLSVEKMEVGRRSKTTIAILYFEDIVDKNILLGIKEKISKVDIDIVVSSDLLMESVNKLDFLFPRTDYTGRPDSAVQSLARGRFVILADGVSYAIVTPVNLFLLLKSGEDNEYPVIFSSMERLLRVGGVLIGLLLPAFWLALITFHQNQLPLQLLATVVQSNTGLPFPTALEMLLMLLMFELFREASLSLPTIIGGTISVVGGLIIGDAAIRAGVTSPAMIVIIATSTVAAYSLSNQALLTAVTIFRIVFIIITSFFGMFGFLMCLYFLLIYLASIRVFGVPYLAMGADLSWSTIFRALFRLPAYKYTQRPDMLNPNDATRMTGDKHES